MDKHDGHVMTSPMGFLEKESGSAFPKGWNVKSKCRPVAEEEVDKLLEGLNDMKEDLE